MREREGRLLAIELDTVFNTLRHSNNSTTATTTSSSSSTTAATSTKTTAAKASLDARLKTMTGAAKKTVTAKRAAARKAPKTVRTVRQPGAAGTSKQSRQRASHRTSPRNTAKDKTSSIKTATATKLANKSQPKSKQTPKPTSRAAPCTRTLREKVTEAKFALAFPSLNWSRWQTLMVPSGAHQSTDRPVPHRSFYVRRAPNLRRSAHKAAVYELAVQTHARSKRYVMFARVTSGVRSRDWMRSLFGRAYGVCDAVLRQGGDDISVCVRRAFLAKNSEPRHQHVTQARKTRSLLNRAYSYAWNDLLKGHRTLSAAPGKHAPMSGRLNPGVRGVNGHGVVICGHKLIQCQGSPTTSN